MPKPADGCGQLDVIPAGDSEIRLGGDPLTVLGALDGASALRVALTELFPGRIAILSSFGSGSAVLLALAAEIDPAVPVLFLQTERHFPETLAYRYELTRLLGLTDVRDIRPDEQEAAREDPDGDLWLDADSCCALRKTRPLERALAPFAAVVNGRRRDQAITRAGLSTVEREAGRIKLNPLADWDAARIAAEHQRRGLPDHPLAARGYPSVGCAPCTMPVRPGDDSRSGRWFGRGKVECGIHRSTNGEARQ